MRNAGLHDQMLAELQLRLQTAEDQVTRLKRMIADHLVEKAQISGHQPRSEKRTNGKEPSGASQESTGRYVPRTKSRPSAAAAIKEAVLNQTKPFSVSEIRAFLKVRHPSIAAQLEATPDRISKELYQLRKSEVIQIELESKGAPTTYRLKQAA